MSRKDYERIATVFGKAWADAQSGDTKYAVGYRHAIAGLAIAMADELSWDENFDRDRFLMAVGLEVAQ